MTMPPGLRKLALVAHVSSSVGWLGAVAAFEALAVTGLVSRNPPSVRAAYLAMEPTAWFVIVPLAFASLLTGLLMALGTKWGLLRHYWILAKFAINVVAIVILLLHTRLISLVASAATDDTLFSEGMRGPRIQLVVIAGAALLALLTATTLAVFKPPGTTPYGRGEIRPPPRSEPLGRTSTSSSSKAPSPNTTTTRKRLPTRVKIAVGVICLVIAIVVVLHLSGAGGPRHLR
jgi:hypothetical protein